MAGNLGRLIYGSLLVVLLALGLCCSAAFADGTVELHLVSNGITQSYTGSGSPSTVDFLTTTIDGWSVHVVFGVSGSPGLSPDGLSLFSETVSCSSSNCEGHPLDILLSDVGFTETVSSLSSTYSEDTTRGTGSSTEQSAWVTSGNHYFGTGTSLGTVGPFHGVGDFGPTSVAGPGASGTYSLTLEDTFTASGNPATFTAATGEIDPTPEPRSVLLFGTGLLLFGTILRRRLLA